MWTSDPCVVVLVMGGLRRPNKREYQGRNCNNRKELCDLTFPDVFSFFRGALRCSVSKMLAREAANCDIFAQTRLFLAKVTGQGEARSGGEPGRDAKHTEGDGF